MSICQSIRYFSATFLFATGGYAAQAQTTDAGIMPFLGLETNARTAGMAGATTAVADNPLAVYANAALSLIGEGHAGGALFSGPWNTTFNSANVLYGAGGFYTPDSRNALLAGVRYFRGPSVGLTDEQLDGFAVKLLEDEKQRQHLYERALDEKVFAVVKENVKVEEQEISMADFEKLFQK